MNPRSTYFFPDGRISAKWERPDQRINNVGMGLAYIQRALLGRVMDGGSASEHGLHLTLARLDISQQFVLPFERAPQFFDAMLAMEPSDLLGRQVTYVWTLRPEPEPYAIRVDRDGVLGDIALLRRLAEAKSGPLAERLVAARHRAQQQPPP